MIEQEIIQKNEFAEKLKEMKAELFEMIDETTMKVVNDEDEYRKYLDFQSRFDIFSISNVMLILAQDRNVNIIKTYDDWNMENARILKGEKSLKLLMPKVVEKENGEKHTYWNVMSYFDVMQTTKKDDKYLADFVAYDPAYLKRSIINAFDVPFETEIFPDFIGGAYYDENLDIIKISKEADDDTLKDMLREAALHEIRKNLDDEKTYDRETLLKEAESISYILSKRFKLDTPDRAEIPESFKGKSPKDTRKLLYRNKKTARNMDEKINRVYERVEKVSQLER